MSTFGFLPPEQGRGVHAPIESNPAILIAENRDVAFPGK